jgi:8-oxo-dGTP diphosphatase
MTKRPAALIPVVAAALVDGTGAILMQQRRLGGRHGGLWEFPGGKVEPDETPEAALVREIREEIGIELGFVQPLAFSSDPETDPARRDPHLILLYLCRAWRGEPRCLDGEAIAWFLPDELRALAMPPLDVPLVGALADALSRKH